MLLQPVASLGGVHSSDGQAIAVPIVAFMAHAFFRSDTVDLHADWREPVHHQPRKKRYELAVPWLSGNDVSTVKNHTLCPGYFAVITCPPKKDSTKKEGKKETTESTPPPPSPPPESDGESGNGGSAATAAGGQDPDDNDPNKKKLPAWCFDEDEEIDEDKTCAICKVNPVTHIAAECCEKKICATCAQSASNNSCTFCGRDRRPIYRCGICPDFKRADLEAMHAHMNEHVRGACGGRRLVYREGQGEAPRILHGTMSEIIQHVNDMLYVQCPFPNCGFMAIFADFQWHIEDDHQSQSCPAEGCNRACDYQHILTHLPHFIFSFEHHTFDGTYNDLIQQLEAQAQWLYCQICIPTDSLPPGDDEVHSAVCDLGVQISSGEACYDHCMNAHASLHCSRCSAQFNSLETQDAQAHVNSHPLYQLIGEEAPVPQLEPLVAPGAVMLVCPYCNEAECANEDELVEHMEECYQPE